MLGLGKFGRPLCPRRRPYILHHSGLLDGASLGVRVERPAGDLERLVIAERIEVGGGSVVDCSYIELPAHEFLAPPATPDEVLTQGHAQHSPCHAVDREMDSRYDAV